jgi:hypothetical protein
MNDENLEKIRSIVNSSLKEGDKKSIDKILEKSRVASLDYSNIPISVDGGIVVSNGVICVKCGRTLKDYQSFKSHRKKCC